MESLLKKASSLLFHPPQWVPGDDTRDYIDQITAIESGVLTKALVLMAASGSCGSGTTHHTESSASRLTIIFAHGNACNIIQSFPMLRRLQKLLDCNIIAPEFPGYDDQEGTPSLFGTNDAVASAVKYATDSLRIKPSSIVLFGHSVGGGPVCQLAAAYASLGTPFRGVILKSAFSSLQKAAEQLVSPEIGSMIGCLWNNEANLKRANCPALIIHGTQDCIIDVSHADLLFQATADQEHCRLAKIDDRGHNDLEDDDYFILISEFSPVSKFNADFPNVWKDEKAADAKEKKAIGSAAVQTADGAVRGKDADGDEKVDKTLTKSKKRSSDAKAALSEGMSQQKSSKCAKTSK
jgi:pimeloyl-ACP methyl ester carboxylesterase